MKHKFINKKTGAEAWVMAMYLDSDGAMQLDSYDKVEDLMDDYAAYEEYKPPKGPLLKDYPNEMDAIKAYGCSPLKFHRHARKGYSTFHFCTHYICFSRLFENLKDGETYTLAELCGEEEE